MTRCLALKASAGSGKTFALTVRYISLLLLDIPPKEILTLTFTNKAAAEMSERIYKTLFSLGDDKTIIDAISSQTNFSKSEIIDKKDEVIKRFISSELSIYTIDKFINKILREFSGYANVSDDFVIEEDFEELLLYKFLTSLNEKKFDSLIKFAYSENKRLSSIVELFKQLSEKNEKLEVTLVDIGSYELLKTSIMDNANKIKSFIGNCPLSASAKKAVDFNSIDELLVKGKTWLNKDTLGDFTYFKKATIPNDLEDCFVSLKEYITYYFRIKERIILNHLFQIYNDFKSFRNQYNKNRNSLEFSDITNIVYELLQKHIDKEFLYFRLDSNYSSILIDEFQDTSVLQYKILEPLIEEIISGSDEKFKTFFYVGDTKQSIYRFRGGTKELFDFVSNEFKDLLDVEVLDVNYRSSKNVVEFVNINFNNLSNYEYYPQKVNSSVDGLVEVLDFQVDDNTEPYKQIGEKIASLLELGVDINNIAILTYTNADVLNLYLYLKKTYPKLEITTEMTSKLIQEQNVQAIINVIKYIYFQEKIYLVNFNTLVGKDYLTVWDNTIISLEELSLKLKNTSIPKLIKQIATAYNLMDQNVIKLIELTNVYANVIDFIYEIDRLDASRVFKDKNGIQILTIFKSKGLEFDTVIVLDRIKRKNINRGSLLFEYDDIKLNNIFHKSSGRENFDELYKHAIEKEKSLSIDDELNILYVALTRAKNNMLIFRKQKSSVFDLLGNNCEISKFGSLYTNKEKIFRQNKVIEVDYKPLILGQQEKQVKSEDNNDSFNIKAKYFGIATHYCLEMMSEFDINSLDNSIRITINKYSNMLDDEAFDDIYNRIKMLIEDDTFKTLIKNADYSKEQALMFDNEMKILDLLIKKDYGYFICDYKTTVSFKDEHKSQVEYYKKAIKDITSCDEVKSFIIYLQKDSVYITEV